MAGGRTGSVGGAALGRHDVLVYANDECVGVLVLVYVVMLSIAMRLVVCDWKDECRKDLWKMRLVLGAVGGG